MNRKDFPNLQSRRDFFRQAACAAVGSLSIATTIRDLRFINTAVAQETLTDYKALVCIFLSGGNDSNNLIIPIGATEYPNYKAVRQNLALYEAIQNPHPTNPLRNVLPVTSVNPDGHDYGMHPDCGELHTLVGEKKAAVLFNVGPLLYPLTRTQYSNNSVAKPPQLFSHSDQVTHWQTSLPDRPPSSGWGGRIADLIHPMQYQLVGGIPTANSAKIALCTSLAGANTFEVGDTFAQYHVSTSGAVALSGVTGARLQAVKDILSLGSVNLQRTAFADVSENALAVGDLLNASIAATAAANYWTVPFPNTNNSTSLGSQLRMVARLIAARVPLNMKRQVFFTSVGGYDTHTAQTGNGAAPTDTSVGAHANLLNELSEAIYAFQRAMEQIGTSNMVTSFTASDFGRTFKTTGQGSDHAWGSHHIVVGGAVNGNAYTTIGAFPELNVSGPDAVPSSTEGRWIPKIAVDQYSATLAKWFGVSSSNMGTVFPNIGHFATPDLGFML